LDDPSSGSGLLLAILLLVLLAMSGSFSATETALFSLNRVERRRLEEDDSPRSQRIARVLRRPRRLLSTLLFGNTVVNVATAAVATVFFEGVLRDHGLITAIVVDTILVLSLGEIIPKTIAVNRAVPIARAAITPLVQFTRVTDPFVRIFDRAARSILALLRVPEEARGALSASELELLFDEAGKKRTITQQERRIVRNILRFSETTAAEIMTPRVELVSAPVDVSREDLARLMTAARHTRLPIYEGSVDHIVGFVSTKEFFLNPQKGIRELVKPVAIFPEGARIHRVFRHMQKHRLNLAVIVNEYGETSGIVTVEDLVEEIVGEIYDEYESAEELIQSIGPDRWLVYCRASVEDVNEACGLSLPVGEAVTLNGYLCGEFGRIPAPDQSIERGGARFTIVESGRRRIVSCHAERLGREAPGHDA
jgi:CBS domain containing-hemolysin-like protein